MRARHRPSPGCSTWLSTEAGTVLLLRLLAVLAGIGIAGSVFAYFFTRDARYLALAWRLFRYTLIIALVFFALLVVERVLVPFV